MTGRETHQPIEGSELPLSDARSLGAARPENRIEVTLSLRAAAGRRPLDDARRLGASHPSEREHLTHAQLAARYGTAPEDARRIQAFARTHGLRVVEENTAARSITLDGTVEALEPLFGIELRHFRRVSGEFRGHTGTVHVRREIADVVEGVFGLDDMPVAEPHIRHHAETYTNGALPDPATVPHYTPAQLATLYDFPADTTAEGECIAILEFGGGYAESDLERYFRQLGLTAPSVIEVPVAGGSNSPVGKPLSFDAEVMLDIEVAGAAAPGAKLAVYFAPNTMDGWVRAMSAVVGDAANRPSVLSVSWGSIEDKWPPQAVRAMEQSLAQAALLGITVCCSSGDHGSLDAQPTGAHVNYPSSSLWALGCGGTSLTESDGMIRREVVWNNGDAPPHGATGGGVSASFDLPDYQSGARVPLSASGGRRGRGVPDVAACADPTRGYLLRVDGVTTVSGGTSAAAPLWAALVARINASLGSRVGYITPFLYEGLEGARGFRNITLGDNGAYHAGPGWDACTGWGTPAGTALRDALGGRPPSSGSA